MDIQSYDSIIMQDNGSRMTLRQSLIIYGISLAVTIPGVIAFEGTLKRDREERILVERNLEDDAVPPSWLEVGLEGAHDKLSYIVSDDDPDGNGKHYLRLVRANPDGETHSFDARSRLPLRLRDLYANKASIRSDDLVDWVEFQGLAAGSVSPLEVNAETRGLVYHTNMVGKLESFVRWNNSDGRNVDIPVRSETTANGRRHYVFPTIERGEPTPYEARNVQERLLFQQVDYGSSGDSLRSEERGVSPGKTFRALGNGS
jgi:hypothetical protein